MTIRKQREIRFSADKAVVVESIRKLLENDPAYYGSLEGINHTFLTHTQPSIFALPTPMNIFVEEVNSAINVVIAIKSQPFIQGDIFGFYKRSLDRFVISLKREVESNLYRHRIDLPTLN